MPPKIPDRTAFGATPTPRDQRSIIRVDGRPAARAEQASARVTQGIGQDLSHLSADMQEEDLRRQKEMVRLEKQRKAENDRLEMSKAKTEFALGQIALEEKIAQEPDYTKHEALYSAGAEALRKKTSEMITDVRNQEFFNNDSTVDFARGVSRVRSNARAKERSAMRADGEIKIDELRNLASDADTPEDQDRYINLLNELRTTGEAAGWYSEAETIAGRKSDADYIAKGWFERQDPLTQMDLVAKREAGEKTGTLFDVVPKHKLDGFEKDAKRNLETAASQAEIEDLANQARAHHDVYQRVLDNTMTYNEVEGLLANEDTRALGEFALKNLNSVERSKRGKDGNKKVSSEEKLKARINVHNRYLDMLRRGAGTTEKSDDEVKGEFRDIINFYNEISEMQKNELMTLPQAIGYMGTLGEAIRKKMDGVFFNDPYAAGMIQATELLEANPIFNDDRGRAWVLDRVINLAESGEMYNLKTGESVDLEKLDNTQKNKVLRDVGVRAYYDYIRSEIPELSAVEDKDMVDRIIDKQGRLIRVNPVSNAPITDTINPDFEVKIGKDGNNYRVWSSGKVERID